MDAHTQEQARRVVALRRRPPQSPTRMDARWESDGRLPVDLGARVVELFLEATGPQGELAEWLDDEWWTRVIERWCSETLTIHIQPTSGGLLHPVVLHQLDMIRRVVGRWHVVGHARVADITSDDAVELVAGSAYSEIRFVDVPRSSGIHTDRLPPPWTLEELFARIRRAQARVGATRPILVRLPRQVPAMPDPVDDHGPTLLTQRQTDQALFEPDGL